jgi:nucleotidyltransferase AbiEii toxin of type IV toxin-antitoxin system
MSRRVPLGDLASKIVAVHELLDSMQVPHQFGGAIALAFYRNPRATVDIDLNITLTPAQAAPVLGALTHIGVTVSASDKETVRRDGQARLEWTGTYLDVFFATVELHYDMAQRERLVTFGPVDIPILAPEHLVVCKAIFDRPKDWVDIEAMVAWGTKVDGGLVLRWTAELLGADSPQYAHLRGLLRPYTVSDADKAALARQVRALQAAERDDEGTASWRQRRIEEADAERSDHGMAPLKTEPELHRRARDLGLLRR